MLLSHSNRIDYATISSDTGNHVQSESLKNNSDLSGLDQGNTGDLKMVFSKKKIDHSLSYWQTMICFLFILFGSALLIFFIKSSDRRCTYGELTYERIWRYELIRAEPYLLFSHWEADMFYNCVRRCKSDTKCMGFNMDYERNECQGVTKNSKNNLFNLLPSSSVSFFEAICLKGRNCGESYTFERVVDMELTGFVKETVRGISKTDCQDRCLSEKSYSCKSASYDHMLQECYLSTENRFTTQPKAMIKKNGTDYLENQCEDFKVAPTIATVSNTTISRKTTTTTGFSTNSTLTTTSPVREGNADRTNNSTQPVRKSNKKIWTDFLIRLMIK